MNDLFRINDFVQYLNKLSSLSDCLVIMAIKDTLGHNVGENGYKALLDLGLTIPNYENRYKDSWKGYVAVIKSGQIIYEELSEYGKSVRYEKIIDTFSIDILSCSYICGNICSIIINNEEYAVNSRGLNIVVYSLSDKTVIDSVAFDTHVERQNAIRKIDRFDVAVKPSGKNELIIRDLNDVRNRLNPSYFLPKYVKRTNSSKSKVKIRFFYWGIYTLWNSIESVVSAFANDPRFDVLIVLTLEWFEYRLVNRVAKCGIPFVFINSYKAEKDNPDITVFNWNDRIKNIKSSKYSVLIPSAIANGLVDDKLELLRQVTKTDRVDHVLVDKYLYNQLIADDDKNKYRLFGNPKFDLIYDSISRKCFENKKMEKISGKKVVLWAYDHNWWLNSQCFDLYARKMFDVFSNRNDVGLIIRPHGAFIEEMIRDGIWTQDDYEAIKNYCETSSNIVFDDSDDYGDAYRVSSAIITDINCGICISALPLRVPIAVLGRYDGNECSPQYPEVYDSLYKICSENDVDGFLDMVVSGEDELKHQRNTVMDKYVSNFDGKNGQRIKDFIAEEYFKNFDIDNVLNL